MRCSQKYSKCWLFIIFLWKHLAFIFLLDNTPVSTEALNGRIAEVFKPWSDKFYRWKTRCAKKDIFIKTVQEGTQLGLGLSYFSRSITTFLWCVVPPLVFWWCDCGRLDIAGKRAEKTLFSQQRNAVIPQHDLPIDGHGILRICG